MSLDLIVRDPETKATYRVNTDPDAELGRGALGVVYLGRLETGEGDSKVAVKNALPNLNEADLADFVPCSLDQWRDQKYLARRQEEERRRAAIRTGEKVYDARGE